MSFSISTYVSKIEMEYTPKHCYDVVVVGGGPAGASAALVCAQQGLRTLVLEKTTFPRDKLCGGFVTDKAFRLIERVFGKGIDELRRVGLLEFEAQRYTLYFKKSKIAEDQFDTPLRFVKRSKFDAFLLGLAESRGARVKHGEVVTECSPSLLTVATENGSVYKAKFIIGCDGVNSLVRRKFPEDALSRARWYAHLGMGTEVFICRSKLPFDLDHPKIFFGFIKNGYCWAFPRNEDVALGMGGLNRANSGNFKKKFLEFLQFMGIQETHTLTLRSHPIPYGNYLLEPANGDVLLAGDAAGFADPLLGEGIFYAILSGTLAGLSVASDRPSGETVASDYIHRLHDEIVPLLRYWDEKARLLFSCMNIPVLGSLAVRMIVKWKKRKLFHRISEGPQMTSLEKLTNAYS